MYHFNISIILILNLNKILQKTNFWRFYFDISDNAMSQNDHTYILYFVCAVEHSISRSLTVL